MYFLRVGDVPCCLEPCHQHDDELPNALKHRHTSGISRLGQVLKKIIGLIVQFRGLGNNSQNEVKPAIAEFLATRGLELSEEKTSVTHIDTGFDFLGQNVRKYDGKLLITPSKKNVAAFLANMGQD
jgi:hypothetical protein